MFQLQGIPWLISKQELPLQFNKMVSTSASDVMNKQGLTPLTPRNFVTPVLKVMCVTVSRSFCTRDTTGKYRLKETRYLLGIVGE